jgi:hypothetical protein
MATSTTSCNFSHKPTDGFRHYNGPRTFKQTQKRKVDPSPRTPNIDDIPRSGSAGLTPVSEPARDTLEGGDEGTY